MKEQPVMYTSQWTSTCITTPPAPLILPALFWPFILLCNSNRLKKLLCPPYALRSVIDMFMWVAKITAATIQYLRGHQISLNPDEFDIIYEDPYFIKMIYVGSLQSKNS